MTNERRGFAGTDSHKDTIHVAVITALGQPVADREFATTGYHRRGHHKAVSWLIEHGPLQAVGIEGSSSYGIGIATAVTLAGMRVVGVNRTRPAERRRQGKSDQLDAYRAARSVLSGEATTDPKRASIEAASRAKNLILTAAAGHLGVWPARVGELELGRRPNDDLARRSREWLQAA
jgi:hypothetical protein